MDRPILAGQPSDIGASPTMPELAYIDAGSGSLIIQAVIAAAIAVPLFFRHHIGRFLAVVRRRGEPDKPSVPVDDSARGR